MYSIYKFNNGEIRIFIFIGILLGNILYLLTISKFFINFSYKVLSVLIKYINLIIIKPIKIFIKFINKIIIMPCISLIDKLKQKSTKKPSFFVKKLNKIKKRLQLGRNIGYNVEKYK